LSLGGAAMGLAVASSLAVALLVLALVRHTPSPQPTSSAPSAAAAQLISRLGILRRPQTAADRTLPAQHTLRGIIPGLTRLALDTGGLKVWVVVIDVRAAGVLGLAPYGAWVALVARIDGQNYVSSPLPVAGLRRPVDVRNAGGWIVELVPDGVARTQWSFPVKTGTFHLHGRVVNNVAFAHLGAAAVSPVAPTTWFAADGRILAASAPAQSAVANEHFQIPAAVARELPRPATILRDHVSVSMRGAAGLPPGILSMATGGRNQIALPLILTVTAGDGVTFWVAPSANGLCVFAAESPHSGVGTCSPTVAAALAQGAWTNLRGADGREWLVGVVPRSRRHVTVQLKSGSTRKVPVVDGIVITPAAGTASG
jgi:hypothetical protein